MISHDSSLIRYADRALVIAGGIVESGAHAQLMRADGPYAALFTADSTQRWVGVALSTRPRRQTAPLQCTLSRGRHGRRWWARSPGQEAPVWCSPHAGSRDRGGSGRGAVASIMHPARPRPAPRPRRARRDVLAAHDGDLLAVVAGGRGRPGGQHTVLGRLHPSQDAALEYMQSDLGRRPLVRSAAGGPWHTHPLSSRAHWRSTFPIDPDLPRCLP